MSWAYALMTAFLISVSGLSSWGLPSAFELSCPIPVPPLHMRTAAPCTLVLCPQGATGSHLLCPGGTLPTHSLATVTLLATHSLCPQSTRRP